VEGRAVESLDFGVLRKKIEYARARDVYYLVERDAYISNGSRHGAGVRSVARDT
jgi:hypothetical protein